MRGIALQKGIGMKAEIKKAIVNKYFICICAFGILLSILHCYQVLTTYNDFIIERENIIKTSEIQYNPLAEITSAFTMWIGFDRTNTLAKIFFLIFPLMAVLPYCWSYCSDMKSGNTDKDINRIGKYEYYLNKYTSIFISSGLTIAIALTVNFLIILLFVPAIKPDSVYDIYYGIFSNNFMAEMFYNMPFIYVLTFILMNFIFCGLFGCLGYAISTIIKSRIVAVIFPVAFLYLIEFINNKLIEKYPISNIEFSPLSFLCPTKSFTTNWVVIITELLILFFVTFYFSVFRFKISSLKHNKRCFYEDEE